MTYQLTILDKTATLDDYNEGEQACGRAQDLTHTEFICQTNTPESNCWLEVK